MAAPSWVYFHAVLRTSFKIVLCLVALSLAAVLYEFVGEPPFLSIVAASLLVVAIFILRELNATRKQISLIRQFLEWFAVGMLENEKNSLTAVFREYIEKTREDLVREGLHDGTLTEQQARDFKAHRT